MKASTAPSGACRWLSAESIWFAAVTLLALVGLRGAAGSGPAARAGATRIAGYMFALSVPGLAVVLYLAYASLFVLKTYCLFCFSPILRWSASSWSRAPRRTESMTGLPRRALGDLRALVTSPVGLGLAVAFGAGAIALVALFPRQVDAVTPPRARPPPRPCRALETAEQSNFDQWYASLPRVPMAVPTDGAKVLIVKFNDYQCPPCRHDLGAVQARHREVHGAVPGQGEVRDEGLPARRRVQRQHARRRPRGGVRSGRGRAAGARQGPGRRDGRVAVRQPAADYARPGASRARAASAASRTSRRSTPRRSNW